MNTTKIMNPSRIRYAITWMLKNIKTLGVAAVAACMNQYRIGLDTAQALIRGALRGQIAAL